MEKKLFAVSIDLSRDSKWDYEECHLVMAEDEQSALSQIKREREEEDWVGYYQYEVVAVDMKALAKGESQRVYGAYHN